MAEQEDGDSLLAELSTLPADEPTKRVACHRCKRPLSVCICSCLPPEAVNIHTTVIILQHPHEESRSLATVPLLKECLSKDKCYVIRGKRFASSKHPALQAAMQAPNTYLLFPGRNAVDIRSIPPADLTGRPPTLIALDGTWSQASGMYYHNPQLQRLTQVQLGVEMVSEYVIRTQPTQESVSTLECVAHALAWLEQDQVIVEALVRPLRALCQHQLDHGAVKHVSKDHPDYISRWEFKKMQSEVKEDR